MVPIELVLRDALAFEHRQYMETDVVDHWVVAGDHESIAFEAGAQTARTPCVAPFGAAPFAELRSDA